MALGREKFGIEDKRGVEVGKGCAAHFHRTYCADLLMKIGPRAYLYFENANEALVPPKPKLFEIDTLTSFCWAHNGT
jgi:hypothetical protein